MDTATPGRVTCGERVLDLTRVAIMGILNVTPDSFSDGGRFYDIDSALRQAESMCENGADIIDVGGESTRPGAESVSIQQEIDRVVPVIEALDRNMDVVISIDTSKAAVMSAALAAGATMVNDVNALRDEAAMGIVAESQVPVCLMHMQGEPRTMQKNPTYDDVVREVTEFLLNRASECVSAGIQSSKIILDPGFGFGKAVVHNIKLLQNLKQLGNRYPIMVGLSRKSMIGKLLGLPMDRRVYASVALALLAAQNGAKILRVHDVGPTSEAIRMYEALYSGVGVG